MKIGPWQKIVIGTGPHVLDYWRAKCSVPECTLYAELKGRVPVSEVRTITPKCPFHE